MKYLLGIDFGGGSSKATLIDTNGNIAAENSVEYPTLHPSPDACEQAPSDWTDALCRNIRELLSESGISSSDILCVAIDSATHTFLVCNENKSPIRNAIHWSDSRSRKQAGFLLKEYGEMIFNTSFHKPDTIWTLPQLLWLKENEPENFSKIKYLFFEKDYIRFFLTDVYCTDHIEAQGSMLFDCRCLDWSDDLCALAGINKSILPPVVKPYDIIGKVTVNAGNKTGLSAGTQVICGTTDTCMEILASGAAEKGDITVKLATAGRICVITDKPYPARHLINYSHIAPGLWYPGTATKAAASSYRWYRDTFGSSYKELDAGAEEITLGCDGLMFHPYINGELTPYADPTLCGSFAGIRSTHTKAHFSRAVLEGVSLSLLDSKLYLDSFNMPYKNTAALIGGGAKSRLWAQITSDILGLKLRINKSSESSLGSAMLAGIATGVFSDTKDALQKCVKSISMITPDMENHEKYLSVFKDYKRIHDALAPIYQDRL